MFNVFV